MKNKFLLVIVLFSIGLLQNEAKAQSEPMYSQYMFNMLNVNPAYAGARGVNSVSTLFRKQWVDMPGAPQTTVVSLETSQREGRVGLGLQLLDVIGFACFSIHSHLLSIGLPRYHL